MAERRIEAAPDFGRYPWNYPIFEEHRDPPEVIETIYLKKLHV